MGVAIDTKEESRSLHATLIVRGVSEEIGFCFWWALVVTLASCMHAPRYKLHISKKSLKNILRKISYDLVNMWFFLKLYTLGPASP